MLVQIDIRTLLLKMVKSDVFLMKPKHQSFIPKGRMRLWYQIMKIKEIIMSICVGPNQHMYINSKNGRKRCFSYETKASINYPNEENVFIIPKHEMKGYYYVNQCLS